MIIFTCALYYFLVIVGFFFQYYFKKFTASDYYMNPELNLKRVFCIAYHYFILGYSMLLFELVGNEVIQSFTVLISVVIIFIVYISFPGNLEFAISPREIKRKYCIKTKELSNNDYSMDIIYLLYGIQCLR